MIAILTPSRGLIYSKVVDGVNAGIEALKSEGVEARYLVTNDLPIPDSHNNLVERAIELGAERVIFVEEDNYIDPKGFVELARNIAPISTLQYNDKNGSPHGIIHYNEALEILWCGLGATGISRDVFEALGSPYFRTDTRYKIVKKYLKDDKRIVREYERIEPHQIWNPDTSKFEDRIDHYAYGGLDVDFFTRARHAGFRIEKIPDLKSIHLEVREYGKPHTNNGVHTIVSV